MPQPIPNLSMIVALAQNYAIGKDNDLLWHIGDDLKRFKALTSGHTVIMGRNTWNSLPRRPLPKRRNVVLTRNSGFVADGAEVAHSLQEVFALLADGQEAFVMGGAEVYRQLLPFAQRLYVTWVYSDFAADVFFPPIDEALFVREQQTAPQFDPESGLTYSYVDYVRRPTEEADAL